MVVFTCGHCGESVQKPKVEKHYLTKCRNRKPNLSCMDCFKDFFGQDYESHTKCISEEERYSGKGFVSKEKKGEKKQNTWVEMLQSVLDEQLNAPRNVLRIIETVSKHNNAPRKKPKFINFVKNVCGAKTNPNDINQAWDLISVKLADLSNNKNNVQNKAKDSATNDATNEDSANGAEEANKEVNFEESETGTVGTENGTDAIENGREDKENGTEGVENANSNPVDTKKLSKKQKKEEKKRLKYEAELKSAVFAPDEEIKEVDTKKGKKKKNKSESVDNDDSPSEERNGKIKKRKRQDTVCSVGNVEPENIVQPVQNGASLKEKVQKKKQKTEEEEEDSLHDQNVAKIEELTVSTDKFNWHAVIMSVLQKKGNELPFKRLQKKVLAEYSETTGLEVNDRIADKFIKKLKSAPNVMVDKNKVLLID